MAKLAKVKRRIAIDPSEAAEVAECIVTNRRDGAAWNRLMKEYDELHRAISRFIMDRTDVTAVPFDAFAAAIQVDDRVVELTEGG